MSAPIRVVVVDDEALSRERIRTLLATADDVELIGECCDGAQALQAIDGSSPDLVFLDVQMPELNGLAVVEAMPPDRCPQVVFVTGYDIYMQRAFEVHALDYLRKPFTDARFFDALAHARRRIEERRGYQEAYGAVASILGTMRRERSEPETDRLVIREQRTGVYRVIPSRDVDWIEARGKHARVHVGKESYLWGRSLAEAEAVLDGHRFLRVHRSFIVNLARIRTVEPLWKGEYVITLDSGTSLDTGRTYRGAVERFLGRRAPGRPV